MHIQNPTEKPMGDVASTYTRQSALAITGQCLDSPHCTEHQHHSAVTLGPSKGGLLLILSAAIWEYRYLVSYRGFSSIPDTRIYRLGQVNG